MKILILSPYYLPQRNGLAHYTDRFAKELKKRGHNVFVASCQQESMEGEIPVIHFEKCNIIHFIRLFNKIKLLGIDKILIQYVPHMYNPRGGVNFSLPSFIIFLRIFSSLSIEVMFHELHYPFEYSIKSLLLWFCHHMMLIPSLWFSHRSFFSTERFLKKANKLNLTTKIYYLPVGSNISRSDFLGKSSDTEFLKLVIFGGLHVSKKVFEVINFVNSFENVKVKLIGIQRTDFKSANKHILKNDNIEFLGFLPDEEVGRILWDSDFQLAFFIDGISTRRGSALAALNNGLPVITTKTSLTDESLLSFPGLFLSSPDLFFEELKSILLKDLKEIRKERHFLREKMFKNFDEFFSWESIVDRYEKIVFE